MISKYCTSFIDQFPDDPIAFRARSPVRSGAAPAGRGAAQNFDVEFWNSGNRRTNSKRARVSRRRGSRDGGPRVDAKPDDAIARDGGRRRAAVAMAVVTITLVAAAFCLSGSALTVLNKQIMGFFPAPNAVLFAQNAVTLVLLAFGKSVLSLQIEPVRRHKAKRWCALVLLFYAMLASSMLALKFVTATTLIVQRNLGTVTIAIADYFCLGTVQTKPRILAILGMCVGSLVYASGDLDAASNFDFTGYAWLAVNVAATTAYQIKVKSLVNELDMNSWTMAYYNNLLSLPVCAIVGFAQRENETLQKFMASGATKSQCVALFVSCTLGFCLSVSAFQLNRLITPTSITILNNTNKFALIFFTAYFMDYSTLSESTVAGAAIVMICAAHYSFAGTKK